MSYNYKEPIIQLCFAVDDLDAACEKWSKVYGVGPWYRYPAVDFEGPVVFHGESNEMQQGGAVAYSGGLEIELYRRNDGSPAHVITPNFGEPIFHHFCIMAREGEYENTIKRFEENGLKKIWSCVTKPAGPDSPIRQNICWFDTRPLNGALTEIYEYNEARVQGIEGMKYMHANWDGKEIYAGYTPDPVKFLP